MVRAVADLAALERIPAAEARTFVQSAARALAIWEKARAPEDEPHAHVTPEAVTIGARGAASLRAAPSRVPAIAASASLLWTPPLQARGAAWNAAANRYALGLVLYRAIAGVNPAHGERRVRLDPAWSPPPFPETVARELPLGVQATILALLDPDEAARPSSAEAIARLLDGSSNDQRNKGSNDRLTKLAPAPSATRWEIGRVHAPNALGIALISLVSLALAAAAGLTRGSDAPVAPKPPIGEAKPPADLHAESCAPCHAREVTEWKRSAMAFAGTSPLFGALESVVEEQVERSNACPGGGGVLRPAGANACVERSTGQLATGAGGEGWCTNCHIPGGVAAGAAFPAWSSVDARSRRPTIDLDRTDSNDGIGCVTCHAAIGSVGNHTSRVRSGSRAYEGNATWTSPFSGQIFFDRPEADREGAKFDGIGNSGYRLDTASFLLARTTAAGDVHRAPTAGAARYGRSSEACGACHDVRLFGTDVLGAAERGEHFKRLRNVYSEWREWSDHELAAGRAPASCQDCHMSLYPGVCVPSTANAADAGSDATGCPSGTHFEEKKPGERALGFVAPSSAVASPIAFHGFTGVERPLANGYDDAFSFDPSLDASGTPNGLNARREMLLRRTFRFELGAVERSNGHLSIPVRLTNVGAGHRAPAGFSQERETWIELEVTDARGARVYRVGHVDRPDEDLHDKIFERVTTRDDGERDRQGRPLGVFGADIVDGPDVPVWSREGTDDAPIFRGHGLANLQNGFLRCVRCIGRIDANGVCLADRDRGQGVTRADRFADGDYDLDTGECRSNLTGERALFETYFPLGALDATRGVAKAPDAIVDTRSAPPGRPTTYLYDLETADHPAPFTVRASLHFRAFPPFLLRAFADYETMTAARGDRPSGAQITPRALGKLDVIDLASASAVVP